MPTASRRMHVHEAASTRSVVAWCRTYRQRSAWVRHFVRAAAWIPSNDGLAVEWCKASPFGKALEETVAKWGNSATHIADGSSTTRPSQLPEWFKRSAPGPDTARDPQPKHPMPQRAASRHRAALNAQSRISQ